MLSWDSVKLVIQFYDLFITGLRKRSTKWAKGPWKNKNKYCKRNKYKKVFTIYQILDCSIKLRYSVLSIANSSWNPINASNTLSGVTNTSLLINRNYFLFDFLDRTFCKYFPGKYFSPEFSVWPSISHDLLVNSLSFCFEKNKQPWWVIRNQCNISNFNELVVMLPCHFFHLATKNRHRFEPCCELYDFFYSSTFFKVKKISFPNNDKHFPDIFIDKLDLFRSFHDPHFSCPICLAIHSIKSLICY